MSSPRSLSAGLSIVEVLIGIFLVGVTSVAIIGLATIGTRLSIESERQTVAQAIVNDRIEFIRSLPYESVGYTDATGDEPDGVVVRSEAITRNQQQYDVTITIELIDNVDNGSLPSGGLTEPNSDYKLVTVDATWTSAGGAQRNVAVTTYVAAGVNLESCTPGVTSCPDGDLCPLNGVCRPPEPQANCPTEAFFCGGASSSTTYITTADQLFVYEVGQDPQLVGTYNGSFANGSTRMLDVALASTGELYGIADDENNPSQPTTLYRINRTTAQITSLGDVDSTNGATYTSATFLSDGRLAIGGPEHMKFITITSGSVTNTEDLNMSSTPGTVWFSGDLVERNGNAWFIGHDPNYFTGDYCYEADLTTGVITRNSATSLGYNAWGAVCEDAACDGVRVFMGSGITKVVDPDSCLTIIPGYDTGSYIWEGATK